MRISKNEKGITLIALTITIIVLMIVTSITIVNMESSMKIKRVNKLYNDISNLKTKIDAYYIEHKELPILEQYCESQAELKSILETNGVSNIQLDKNDDEYYYVIDLSKIEGLTLSYGKEYNSDLSTDKGRKDLYIINNRSHQIYYPKTVSFNKKYYYSYLGSDKTITIGEISSVNGEINAISENIEMNYSILSGTKVKLITNIIITDEGKENCKYQFAWSSNSENATNYKDFPSVTDWSQTISLESEKLGAGSYWLYIKRINEIGNEEIKKVKFNSEGDNILPVVIEEKSIILNVLNSNEKVGVKISFNNVQIEDLKYGIGTSVEEAKSKLSKFPKDLIDENLDENITEYSIMEEDGIDLTKYLYVQGKEKDKENITSAYIYLLQEANSVDSETSMYNCLNTEIVDGRIYGNTVQETRSGKNLFDIKKYFSQYLDNDNNMVYSKNDFVTIHNNKVYIDAKENTRYTISFDYEIYSSDTGEGNGIGIIFYDENGRNLSNKSIISAGERKVGKLVLTSPAKTTVSYIDFAYITEMRECEEVKLSNIQIEQGTIATEYEAYGKAPSPEYPGEIQSVGNKTVNLINYTKIANETSKGISYNNNNDGSFTANGTLVATLSEYSLDIPELEQGVVYYGSCGQDLNEANRRYYLFIMIKDTTTNAVRYFSSNTTNKTFTLAKNEKVTSLQIRINDPTASSIVIENLVFKPILCKNQEYQGYEPYGKYKIPINIEGKNLFDISKTDTNMTSKGYMEIANNGYNILKTESFRNGNSIGIFSTLVPNLKVGDKFKVDFETNAIRDDKDVNYIYLNLYGNTLRKGIEYTATQEMLDSKMYIYSGGTENCYYKNIMIYLSEYTSEFEAYVEPVVTNIYLNEPLRKIGDFSDYIDLKTGKVVRAIQGMHITSNLGWSDNWFPDALVFNLKKEQYSNTGHETKVLTPYSTRWSFGITNVGGTAMGFRYCNDWGFTSMDDMKNWLDNHPDMWAYYPLAQSKEEDVIIPDIILTSKTSILRVNTEIKPSYIECKYFSNID